MIRSEVHALRTAMAASPLDPAWAPFEAAMLVRAAARPGECRGPGVRPTVHHAQGADEPGLLAEFDTMVAAGRLVAAVGSVAPGSSVESVCLGGRHRYEIHRVIVPLDAGAHLGDVLARSASAGGTALHTTTGAGPRGRRRENIVAAAAWRAALLAVGPGRGGRDGLAVRIGDGWSARTLVAAAGVLGVPVRAVRRPGGQLLTVDGREAIGELVRAVTGATGAPVSARDVGLAG